MPAERRFLTEPRPSLLGREFVSGDGRPLLAQPFASLLGKQLDAFRVRTHTRAGVGYLSKVRCCVRRTKPFRVSRRSMLRWCCR